jgi:hypothetical protein
MGYRLPHENENKLILKNGMASESLLRLTPYQDINVTIPGMDLTQ